MRSLANITVVLIIGTQVEKMGLHLEFKYYLHEWKGTYKEFAIGDLADPISIRLTALLTP